MSDTPRTDACYRAQCAPENDPFALARTLERELAEARANADDWMQKYGTQGHGSNASYAGLLTKALDDALAALGMPRGEGLDPKHAAYNLDGVLSDLRAHDVSIADESTVVRVIKQIQAAAKIMTDALAAPSVAQGECNCPIPTSLHDVGCPAFRPEDGNATTPPTYTAPVPAGYTHALDCAYKASPRYHCTCGYVEREVCKHGHGMTDYCQPCGRINGGGA